MSLIYWILLDLKSVFLVNTKTIHNLSKCSSTLENTLTNPNNLKHPIRIIYTKSHTRLQVRSTNHTRLQAGIQIKVKFKSKSKGKEICKEGMNVTWYECYQWGVLLRLLCGFISCFPQIFPILFSLHAYFFSIFTYHFFPQEW